MDEADMQLLDNLIGFLEQHRRPQWIDLHNLRMVQYGTTLHLDGHITLPWYYTVRQAYEEIEALNLMIRQEFGNAIELFLHVDYCEEFSCKICFLTSCQVRLHDPEKRVEWTTENVLQNKKHNRGG
jgi:divalent metal cation (Fe/Co/Zn/Cd) transporter